MVYFLDIVIQRFPGAFFYDLLDEIKVQVAVPVSSSPRGSVGSDNHRIEYRVEIGSDKQLVGNGAGILFPFRCDERGVVFDIFIDIEPGVYPIRMQLVFPVAEQGPFVGRFYQFGRERYAGFHSRGMGQKLGEGKIGDCGVSETGNEVAQFIRQEYLLVAH